MTPDEIQRRLKEIGTLPDEEVPLAETLMLLGALDRGDNVNLEPYRHHLRELHAALIAETDEHLSVDQNAHWQLARLNAVLQEQFGYHGDAFYKGYDDPRHINFLDVLDNRSGLPVALGALYLELAQRQGWQVAGISFPGHFLIRFEQNGERVIADPFHGGEELNAGGLRHLLKTHVGPDAELNHEYYHAITSRDVVLRFCNNRKTRFIQEGSYAEALRMVEQELWIAPDEPRLYFDAGVISAKLERLNHAIDYLQKFVAMSQDHRTVAQAKAMLQTFQRHLQ